MADAVAAPVAMDVDKPTDEPTRPEAPIPEPAVAETKPAEGGIVATDGVAEVPKADEASEEPVAKEEVTADVAPATGEVSDDANAATSTDAPATNGTPVVIKTNGKRKSGAGLPDSKKKTPAKGKKKAAPELRLNVAAGEMYMVAMRGYQPWPVIVCDEEMLPESLLSKRPVSAKRIDGTYREDFMEGGKNAKDRRYPIMFLGTNEFAWQVNTELLPFDLDEVKADVESGKQGKKNKALWRAYQVAAEGHDLAYFKQILAHHEKAMQLDAEQREQKELEKKEKAEKASKRKSLAAAESDDADMADADGAPKKAKGSKKRKKDDESDGENEKPAKTPKTKLKLTTKTPKDSASKPKKETKAKKKASEEAEQIPPEEPPMTEEERLQKREKQVLYLRHRLQKGFLSRDQAPKDEDMSSMSDYLKQIEALEDLEAEIIKKTKVHKVLKAMIKLNSLPKEEEFRFKERSSELLQKWGSALASEAEPAATTPATVEPATNGVKHDDEVEKKPVEPVKDGALAEKDASVEQAAPKPSDADGDISMADADKPVDEDVPAVKADAGSSAESAAEAAITTETVTATS